MMLPEPIAGNIDMWRKDIRSANISSVDGDVSNADSHRDNILHLMESDQEVQRLLDLAVEKSKEYYLSASIFRPGDESLKESALAALDALASSLEYAKPNQIARNLGLDWHPKPRG
ncbi:hypothetical protein ACTDI4_11710 [Mesorhizobium sp. PUT5]|uniref:hypothetical protein n=1 Tax=Mesorhizobium sp. PUT5 TaxID=3454629 RepID=UPI003FA48054